MKMTQRFLILLFISINIYLFCLMFGPDLDIFDRILIVFIILSNTFLCWIYLTQQKCFRYILESIRRIQLGFALADQLVENNEIQNDLINKLKELRYNFDLTVKKIQNNKGISPLEIRSQLDLISVDLASVLLQMRDYLIDKNFLVVEE